MTTMPAASYKGHRFPAEIISHAVWLYFRSRRDKQAALRFFRKVLKRCRYVPRVIITDKLARYGAATRKILPGVAHRRHKGFNNRAENSHQPTRQRARPMRHFKAAGHAQRFLSAFEPIAGHLRRRRRRLPAADYRAARTQQFASGNHVTGVPLAV
jgi:putative transposase